MSYLFPFIESEFQYSIKRIIKEIYNNFNNGLIIGASISLRLQQQYLVQLGEIYIIETFMQNRILTIVLYCYFIVSFILISIYLSLVLIICYNTDNL